MLDSTFLICIIIHHASNSRSTNLAAAARPEQSAFSQTRVWELQVEPHWVNKSQECATVIRCITHSAKLLDNFLLFRDFQTNTGMFKLPCIHLITLAGNYIVGFRYGRTIENRPFPCNTEIYFSNRYLAVLQ